MLTGDVRGDTDGDVALSGNAITGYDVIRNDVTMGYDGNYTYDSGM